MAIFVIMDALGNIPIFYGLNKSFSEQEKKKNIALAVLIAGIVLVIFLFLGNHLLNFFGIRISSFKIAGGIILLILGIEITLGIKFKKDKSETKDLAVVPMGTPLLTGPGVITTVLILVGNYGYWIPLLAGIANLILAFILLRLSGPFLKIFGKQGAEVFSRIMGLIIVAIAVEFVRQGWAAL
ncbi:MAG: MarC family protein [Nanoarchaeota archaeon]|nr:MarC family protein [Nanoarchaeota archaeon]MBU1004582.1 MarC family protein [Nanoarchaeota archaeon]MBU1946992.1 MarC family protein [Nanoarchaeota archaeon]